MSVSEQPIQEQPLLVVAWVGVFSDYLDQLATDPTEVALSAPARRIAQELLGKAVQSIRTHGYLGDPTVVRSKITDMVTQLRHGESCVMVEDGSPSEEFLASFQQWASAQIESGDWQERIDWANKLYLTFTPPRFTYLGPAYDLDELAG